MLKYRINEKLREATLQKDELAKQMLRLVKGELDTADARQGVAPSEQEEDNRIINIMRKLVESNKQTINDLDDVSDKRTEVLLKEIDYLSSFLPKEPTEEEVHKVLTEVHAQIKEAKSDGQANGVAFKHLKLKGMNAAAATVKEIVGELRK